VLKEKPSNDRDIDIFDKGKILTVVHGDAFKLKYWMLLCRSIV
jgi:hypothetical protein